MAAGENTFVIARLSLINMTVHFLAEVSHKNSPFLEQNEKHNVLLEQSFPYQRYFLAR